jgi:glycosyltransferase involved in cell wall biosynthesis
MSINYKKEDAIRPMVSVLVTSYNREKFIAEAIESVLASSYNDFELIIVDDCSTDNTVTIAKSFIEKDARIKVFVNEENLKQFGNRNKAASYAKGKYLKYLDSDDVMFPHCLEVMVNAMEQYPDAAVGAITINKLPEGTKLPVRYTSKESYINHFFFNYPLLYIGPSGCIFKRTVFEEVGGFDEHIGILSDTLLMLKIAAQHSVVGFDNGLFHWRVHDEQVTVGQGDWYEMQRQRYEINDIVLSDVKVPLSPAEAKTVMQNMRNIVVRNIIQRLFSKGTVKECWQLVRYCKLSLQDMLLAIIPNKRLESSI